MPQAASPTPDVTDPRGSARRVAAFLVERFPPAPQLVLMVVLFVAATTMAGILLAPDIGGHLGDVAVVRTIAAFAGSLLFIVRLRVFDDVKDADTDRVENPTRPIPRGLVTVRELDVTSVFVLVIEGVLIAQAGSTTFAMWGIAAAWSVLMRFEFFVPRWLDEHPAIYAISHMVVMGIIFGMLLAMGIELRGGDASLAELLGSWLTIGAMLASTSIGIGFEWGRKFERYFAPHGEWGWCWWMLWPSLGALGFTLLARDAYDTWVTVALATVTMLIIVSHALVMGQRARPAAPGARGDVPTGPLREAVEIAPGAAGLLIYLVLAVAGVVDLVS